MACTRLDWRLHVNCSRRFAPALFMATGCVSWSRNGIDKLSLNQLRHAPYPTSTRNGVVTCHFHSFQENGRASVRMTRASAAVEIFLWFAAARPCASTGLPSPFGN